MSEKSLIEKCLTPRIVRRVSRRAGYAHALPAETIAAARRAMHSYLSHLVSDAVLYGGRGKSLRLSHVQLALERRGILLCGIESVARRKTVRAPKAPAKAEGKTLGRPPTKTIVKSGAK